MSLYGLLVQLLSMELNNWSVLVSKLVNPEHVARQPSTVHLE